MQQIKMKLNCYDHGLLESSVKKIVDATKRSEARVRVVPLPTDKERFSVRRSTFVNSKSGYKYLIKIHKRLVIISFTSPAIWDELNTLDLPAGIGIKIVERSE